jgi:beta-lactamase regulating signal transducer with metallopeptidase domain
MTLLWAASLRASIVMLAALCSLMFMRRSSAALRHALLAVATITTLLMPILTFVMPSLEIRPPKEAALVAQPIRTILLRPVAAPERPAVALVQNKVAAQARMSWVPAVWLAGVLIGTTVMMTGLWSLWRLTCRSRPSGNSDWNQAATCIAHELGLRRRVLLLETQHPSILATWGALRPAILLPSAAGEWNAERTGIVLRHELAHVKRWDWTFQIFAQILRIAMWFNPLAWIMCTRLKAESEAACDDATIRSGISGFEYARHLLKLVQERNAYRPLWSGALEMAESSSIERRFAAMVNSDVNRRPLSLRALITIVFVTGLLAMPLAAMTAASEGPRVVTMPPEAVVKPPVAPLASAAPHPAIQAPAASGEVHGTVHDSAGRPVAGVSLILSAPLTADQIARIDAATKERRDATRALTSQRALFNSGRSTLRQVFEAQSSALQARMAELSVDFDLIYKDAKSSRTETTDAQGTYRMASLPPGRYGMRALMPDMFYAAIANIELRPGDSLRQDFELESADASAVAAVAGTTKEEAIVETSLSPQTEGESTVLPARQHVTPPRLIRRVDPVYTSEARKVQYQGTVLLQVTVGVDGSVHVDRVARSLDSGFGQMCRQSISEGRWPDAPYPSADACPDTLGLDQAAIDSVSQWKFEPATRDGKPVPVAMNVEVRFNLK